MQKEAKDKIKVLIDKYLEAKQAGQLNNNYKKDFEGVFVL